MNEKIVGYILLTIGLGLIVWALVNVYMVMTGSAQPIALFDLPSISLDLGSLLGNQLPPGVGGSMKQELVQGEVLNKSFNVIGHLLFMGFVASIGQKIASIGTSMVRPIEVRVSSGKKELVNTKQ